jgi:hypothetical protein
MVSLCSARPWITLHGQLRFSGPTSGQPFETVDMPAQPGPVLEVLKAGLSLVGALVGGYYGARWALRRFKEERAHDKRLQWHLDALNVIHDMEAEYTEFDFVTGARSSTFDGTRERFRRIMIEGAAFMLLGHAHYLVDAFWSFEKAYWVSLSQPSDVDADTVSRLRKSERAQVLKAREAILAGLQRLMPDNAAEDSFVGRMRANLAEWLLNRKRNNLPPGH